jgi:ligand-binding sensor domain-containing protein
MLQTSISRNVALLFLLNLTISCKGIISDNKAQTTANSEFKELPIPVPKNGFSCSFVDMDSSIWLGSNGGGVFHINGNSYKNFTVESGLSSNQVFAVAKDKYGYLWFGTQNGLTKYNGEQFEHIPLPYQDTTKGWISKVYPVLNPNAAHSLAVDNNDCLWIGTAGGGAYCYDGKEFNSYLTEIGWKQDDSLYHNWIPSIIKDRNGNMWFASMTHGGVQKLNGTLITQFLLEDGLSDDMVRTIYEDSKGNIWFGFNGNRNNGLTVYDGTNLKTYTLNDGLCNQRTRAFCEDKNGNLWIGPHFGNLCIFNGDEFSEFRNNGAAFSCVLIILEDLYDNIWFGGSNGLWMFDGEHVIEKSTNS